MKNRFPGAHPGTVTRAMDRSPGTTGMRPAAAPAVAADSQSCGCLVGVTCCGSQSHGPVAPGNSARAGSVLSLLLLVWLAANGLYAEEFSKLAHHTKTPWRLAFDCAL